MRKYIYIIGIIILGLGIFLSAYIILYQKAFGFKYKGDGVFADHGITSTSNRYELVLGTLNLCNLSRYEFDIGYLPRENFGLDISITNILISTNQEYYNIIKLLGSSVVLKIEVNDGNYHTINEGFIRYKNKRYGSLEMLSNSNIDAIKNSRIEKTLMDDKIQYSKFSQVFMLQNFFDIFAYNHPKKHIRITIVESTIDQNMTLPCEAIIKLKGGGWK